MKREPRTEIIVDVEKLSDYAERFNRVMGSGNNSNIQQKPISETWWRWTKHGTPTWARGKNGTN